TASITVPEASQSSIGSPSLFSDGNAGTPTTVPKPANKAALEVPERITWPPGGISTAGSVPVPLPSVIFQPVRSKVRSVVVLKSSTNSALGRPTGGSGSGISSFMITSPGCAGTATAQLKGVVLGPAELPARSCALLTVSE